ncbi:MAG: glucosaminidase domain-containing protein [Deltaproteobacteria bacterium]|nr:glucosaminidase domain-containing protein [Deltaproteobacteria bacterium]
MRRIICSLLVGWVGCFGGIESDTAAPATGKAELMGAPLHSPQFSSASAFDVDAMVRFFSAHFFTIRNDCERQLGVGESFVRQVAQLYAQEAALESVNAYFAWAQMTYETDKMRWTRYVKANQCNFAGMKVGGYAGGDAVNAFQSFASAQIGVRAHIQHIVAYATTKHESDLATPVVDNRFHDVKTVVTQPLNTVAQICRKWGTKATYCETIGELLGQVMAEVGQPIPNTAVNNASVCQEGSTIPCGSCGVRICNAGSYGACLRDSWASCPAGQRCNAGGQCEPIPAPTYGCQAGEVRSCRECGEQTCQADGSWSSCGYWGSKIRARRCGECGYNACTTSGYFELICKPYDGFCATGQVCRIDQSVANSLPQCASSVTLPPPPPVSTTTCSETRYHVCNAQGEQICADNRLSAGQIGDPCGWVFSGGCARPPTNTNASDRNQSAKRFCAEGLFCQLTSLTCQAP